jgi:hypothetical protein
MFQFLLRFSWEVLIQDQSFWIRGLCADHLPSQKAAPTESREAIIPHSHTPRSHWQPMGEEKVGFIFAIFIWIP